jgi:hypothetical protein
MMKTVVIRNDIKSKKETETKNCNFQDVTRNNCDKP